MELSVCAIVLVLVGSHSVRATPHGYGVKTGAAAQAVAGASAGAFGGAAGLPIALPHGAGFSGSYSKSASSSFAASSASSSSSSFSFSGSGITGPAGECTSGLCPNADTNGRVPNGNTNGFYSNNGANALAGAQAGAIAGSQTFNKDGSTPLCSGSNCPNQNGANCKGSNCNGVTPNDNKCEYGKCGSQSPESSTYDKEPNEKCTSGQCNTGGHSEVQDNSANSNNNLNSEDGNKCTSGNCETTSPNDVSPSASYPSNNCASGQCGPSSDSGKPTAYGGNSYPNKPAEKCTSGQCGPSSENGGAPSAYGGNSYPDNPKGSSIDTANYGVNSYSHNSPEKCTSGQCAPSFNNGSPSEYGDNSKINNPNSSKCTSGQCGTSAGDNLPPNYDSTNEKCKSGQCKPLPNGVTSSPEQHNSYDIPVNIASTASVKPSLDFGSTAQSSPGCLSGNCGTFPASKPTPSYTHGSTNTYSRPNYSNQKPIDCDSPDCNNGAYNPHVFSPSDVSLPAYNKPVTYLIAPKQEPSCTSPNCQSASTIPGYYPSGSITPISGAYPTIPSNTKKPTCSNGNCGATQPNPNSYSVPLIPNQSNYGYKPSRPICTTGNCDNTPQTGFGTTQNVPYSSSSNSPNVPHDSTIPTATAHGYSTSFNPSPYGPNNHLSTQSVPQPQHSPSNFKPTQPQGPAAFPSYSTQPTSSPTAAGPYNPKDNSIPPFVPLTPPKSSNCGASPCLGNSLSTYPSIPTEHPLSPTSSYYPGTYNTGVPSAGAKKPEMPYHGGFGAPSGLLKPNDFTLPSTQLSPNTKPTAATVGDHTIPCASGNCNSQPQYGQNGAGATAGKPLGTHSPGLCSSGKCGPQNGQTGAFNLNGANSAASAVASANADAVAYSGGFGGPPGLLKPFDDGKLTSRSMGLFNGKSDTGSTGVNTGHYPTNGDHNTAGNGALSGAGAHAAAVAGATAGAFGGAPYHHGANDGHGSSGGCSGGCNGGHPKGGYGAISAAGAAAKSISFGSSFASAHASAGAATKGGYGR